MARSRAQTVHTLYCVNHGGAVDESDELERALCNAVEEVSRISFQAFRNTKDIISHVHLDGKLWDDRRMYFRETGNYTLFQFR